MTEYKLEQLVKQSLEGDGAREAASALRAYLPAKARWAKAKKVFRDGLKIGSIVRADPRGLNVFNHPAEIIGISEDKDAKYWPYIVKNLITGDVGRAGPDDITPYDEGDAFRAINRALLCGTRSS
jgi:hypothetical protein